MTHDEVPRTAVHLFGCFDVTVGGHSVLLASGAQRLVALLALRGRTGRSRLAGSLWPTSTEERALASLRTSIWRVNRSAPGLVSAGPHSVTLEPDVRVDVARMVSASHAVLTGSTTDVPLEKVPDGAADLLPDWEDDWLGSERERLRQLRLHVMEAQAHHFTTEGRYGLALEWALAAVREDPLRESAYRAVIRIHLAEGNLGEAREAFGQLAHTLARELDLVPSEQTLAILRAQERRSPSAAPPRPRSRRSGRQVPVVPRAGLSRAAAR